MSHSFDALELTLRQLTEIVERNHSQEDTSILVKQMTNLVDEMKLKTRRVSNTSFAPPIAASHLK